jgi:nucleoside-diphosphate-sugar epimerase
MKRNDRILVTGGTGFIGGRLVEILAGSGVRVRITTSDFRNCARVARFPVEIIKASLFDHAALASAVVGCDIVFHFAYRYSETASEQRRANVDGTRALAEAFLRIGGRRFVHISSVSAYGAPRDGDLDEMTPLQRTPEVYSDTKQRIEQLLRRLQTQGLPATIVQPTIVYGPYGSTWTTRLLQQVQSNRIALPAGGSGLCNAVYVDDVITACILAAESDAAVGETFLISGSEPVTWRQFYSAYGKMMGREAIVELDEDMIRDEARLQRRRSSFYANLWREIATRPDLRRYLLRRPPLNWLAAALRRLPAPTQDRVKDYYQSLWQQQTPSVSALPPIYLPDPATRALYAARTRVRIDKARNKLGYEPAFDLDRGMALTREWARWANLAPI